MDERGSTLIECMANFQTAVVKAESADLGFAPKDRQLGATVEDLAPPISWLPACTWDPSLG
jgi:hypothetical protein